jgi:hypothetical protein
MDLRYPQSKQITMNNPTFFVDIDREFVNLYKLNPEPIQDVIDFINREYDKGSVIFITTARTNVDELFTKQELEKLGVKYHQIIFDCGIGTRYVVDKDYIRKLK